MMEQKERIDEGNTNAQKELFGGGKEYQNPSGIVYHGKDGLSIVTNKFLGLGIKEKKCAWCGKTFCPTPQWAYGDCCIYSCQLKYEESIEKSTPRGKKVVMMHPRKRTDIRIFDSARDAGEYIGIDARYIRRACNGLTATSGDYAWRWLDERPFYVEPEPPKAEPRQNISVWVNNRTEQELVRLAKIYGVTRNRMATIIVENAIDKKEYGNVEENS